MDFGDFLPTFITECKDNLSYFEDTLMQVSQGDDDPEHIGTMFRAVHSIKGGAGMFDAKPLVDLAHIAESNLDLVRANQIELSDTLLDLLFQTNDILDRYISGLAENNIIVEPKDEEVRLALEKIFEEGKRGEAIHPPDTYETVNPLSIEQNKLTLIIDQDAYLTGLRLEPLVAFLDDEHEVTHKCLSYHGPEFLELNPTDCFLRFEATLTPPITDNDVEDLLSFSAGVEGKIESFEKTLDDSLTQRNDVAASPPQEMSSVANTQKSVEPPTNTATTTAAQVKQKADKVIKVSSNKLDGLVDEVGELVTLKYQIKTLLESAPNTDRTLIRLFDKSIDELRNTALSMRLTPVGESLNRFHRVVREAARMTDKKITLEIYGVETELDRVSIEKLIDPLTHIVRNSCDHGIETPEERVAENKEETGKVTITASYKGSGISILIEDNGRGLNKDKILEKAINNGLVAEDNTLSDKEIYRLIFHAGLSTAEKVTDLSGRGVGMDVVRKNIEELGGDIEIDSTLGKGTQIEINLPLTTAILNGFAVMAGGTMLVVQLDHIQECIASHELSSCLVEEEDCIKLRGDYVPRIDLAKALALAPAIETQEAIVVHSKKGPVALSVDTLIGELQTVVKPLDPLLQRANSLSGIVKMASGDIGFCLDINKLVNNTNLT